MLTANSVPEPNLPPWAAAPYKVLPDKTNPALGLLPSLLVYKGKPELAVKTWRLVKLDPSVLMANTVAKAAIAAGGRSIQCPARQNQNAARIVAADAVGEIKQVRKSGAVDVDGKHRAIVRAAAIGGRPVKDVAG